MRIAAQSFFAVLVFFYSWASPAASGDDSYVGPEFVSAESRPAAFRETAINIVNGFNNSDLDALEPYFDFKAIGARVGRDLFENKREYNSFASGIESAKRNTLTALTRQISSLNGKMILMGYVKRSHGVVPQARIDMGDAGVDYIEFYLDKQADGSYRVVDWYQLSSGRLYSRSVAILAKVMINPNPGILKKLLGVVEFDEENIDLIKKLGQARTRGDYAEANRIFNSLTPEIRDSKVFLEVGIGLANLLGDQQLYRQRLGLLADKHGDDPSAAFLLIDYYYYEGNFDKALANIGVMERKVGKDGLTTYLKGNLYFDMAKDFESAKKLYIEAIDIEPSYEDSYHTLAYIYIAQRDFAGATQVYRLLEENFGYRYTRENFTHAAENAEFVSSREFRQWMASR